MYKAATIERLRQSKANQTLLAIKSLPSRIVQIPGFFISSFLILLFKFQIIRFEEILLKFGMSTATLQDNILNILTLIGTIDRHHWKIL